MPDALVVDAARSYKALMLHEGVALRNVLVVALGEAGIRQPVVGGPADAVQALEAGIEIHLAMKFRRLDMDRDKPASGQIGFEIGLVLGGGQPFGLNLLRIGARREGEQQGGGKKKGGQKSHLRHLSGSDMRPPFPA